MFELNLGHDWRVEGPLTEDGMVQNIKLFIEDKFVGETILHSQPPDMLEAFKNNPQLHGFVLGLVVAKHMFFSHSEVLNQYCETRVPDHGEFGEHILRIEDIDPALLETIVEPDLLLETLKEKPDNV